MQGAPTVALYLDDDVEDGDGYGEENKGVVCPGIGKLAVQGCVEGALEATAGALVACKGVKSAARHPPRCYWVD